MCLHQNRASQLTRIADHMYRMAIFGLIVAAEDPSLDSNRIIAMALVHDIAEAVTGDLTPLCRVSDEEKQKREQNAMQLFVQLLSGSSAAKHIEGLWNEYEHRSSPEARLVKDLDRFELCIQALEYEYGASPADSP